MNVVMPQPGETVIQGTIAALHVKIGDRVESDGLLLDIDTDKVSMEIPAPVINQSQVGILSTHAISKRPVVVSGTEGD